MFNDGWWWFSSSRMTFDVLVHGGVIIDAAPIARKFVGQPVTNLERWMRRQGGLRIERLDLLATAANSCLL